MLGVTVDWIEKGPHRNCAHPQRLLNRRIACNKTERSECVKAILLSFYVHAFDASADRAASTMSGQLEGGIAASAAD